MPQGWQQALDAAIEERAEEIVALRRHLHAHPEPSGGEYATTAYLCDHLQRLGYEVRLGPDGRGAVALPCGPQTGSIALRADIDALRIHEQPGREYCSRIPGLMHACGHDGHSATVYAALLGLESLRAQEAFPWPVYWRGIFQPAEESAAGALEMIAAGALDGVDSILSLHMDPSRSVGRIGVRYGALTAACDELEVTITGRGGHAARPHESLDPIAAAAQLISSLYLFIPRAVDSHNPVVVTFGQIHAGDNGNVIPESACLRGTLRSLDEETRDRTKTHIRQLARGLAEASGTRIDIEFRPGPKSVMNDSGHTDLIREAASRLLGEEKVDVIHRASMGGEDFAFYLDHVPGAMFRLGCGPEAGGGAPLHSPEFDLDERSLLIGAKVLARAVVLGCDPARAGHTGRV